MRRDWLEHAVRTACQIIGQPAVVVVGSQSILGSFTGDDLPPEATMSVGIAILPLVDNRAEAACLADLIEGVAGEWSPRGCGTPRTGMTWTPPACCWDDHLMLERLTHAHNSLRGVALGDAFGETWFFQPAAQLDLRLRERVTPAGPWRWTDDTAMAASVFWVLSRFGEIRQDDLAARFAAAYGADPYRNYGASMHDVLRAIGDGEPWPQVTARQFDGQGSWGNGAAMRVTPLGAYLARDLDLTVEQARLSAMVTHAHPEAAAGAIAVAVAAALATRGVSGERLLAEVIDRTPDGEVATRLRAVVNLPTDSDPRRIAAEVGCGALISAQDTVPYALWCAARHLDDLTEALWATASAGGDIDTTCAIVGGIIAARTGLAGVPADWVQFCEPLPAAVRVPPGCEAKATDSGAVGRRHSCHALPAE